MKKFFKLADEELPIKVKIEDLNNALDKIKNKIDALNSQEITNIDDQPEEISSLAVSANSGGDKSTLPKNVLVVDDLGFVTLQLETLFKKHDFNVTTSKEMFDALNLYKNQDFGYAVLDLFIPTEKEGLTLLEEIKKLSVLCKINTKIVVMSASNKKEHKDKCRHKGADIFVEKTQGWQKKILDFCM
ncbi:MAG: response regulator [bacterium]